MVITIDAWMSGFDYNVAGLCQSEVVDTNILKDYL